jgi:uncharacterized protein (DUF2236 family)
MTLEPPVLAAGHDVTDHGFFGPDSLVWQVLTAPAVSLMIAQVTNLLEIPHVDFQSVLLDHDPLYPTNTRQQRGSKNALRHKGGHFHDRLRRTVAGPLPIIFGDTESARHYAQRLVRFHHPMNGVNPDDNNHYAATDPEAMLFAAVTIIHAALIAYENFAVSDGRLPRRMPDHDRDRYFAEAAQFAVLMGVPAETVPRDAAGVAQYYRSVADKYVYRQGWTAAQIRTAASLAIPATRHDLGRTLADIALMASEAISYSVLPKPSRRLHRIPPTADPLLAGVRVATLPLFALLSLRPVAQRAQRWFLGAAATETLERARSMTASRRP